MSHRPSASDQIGDATLRSFIGYGLKRAWIVIERDLREVLTANGFRITTFSALALIHDNPGVTQTQLARSLDIERSTCVAVVDELEDLGCVKRNSVDGDRRSYALRTTPSGRRTFARVHALVAAHEKRLLHNLSPRERISLRDLLSRIERDGLGHAKIDRPTVGAVA